MLEHFASPKLAKIAQSNGFDSDCIKVWDSQGYLQEETIMKQLNLPYTPAPLRDQLIQWFQYKHQLCIFHYMSVGGSHMISLQQYKGVGEGWIRLPYFEKFETKLEALETGLLEAFKIIFPNENSST